MFYNRGVENLGIEYIMSFLESKGHEVELLFDPGLDNNLYYRNTSLYLAGWNPLDAESTIKLLIHTPNFQESLGIWNYGNYSNHEIDALCEVLSYTIEPNNRKEYLQEIFSIAASEIAWIPLFSNKAFFGTAAGIEWKPRPSLFIWVEEISFKN